MLGWPAVAVADFLELRPYRTSDVQKNFRLRFAAPPPPHSPSPPLPQVNAWLFSDEIYRLLEQQPEQQRLQPAVCAYPERGISLGGLSKAFGLQGLRSGWLVCHDTALLQQVRCGSKLYWRHILASGFAADLAW
jgi:hypothetical protein